jgi:plastocyanin
MVNKFNLFVVVLIVSGMSLMLPFQVSVGQTEGEENSTDETLVVGSNMSDNSAVSENNTITLNATEVGEEQYRWTDSSGAENPTLNLVANNEYTVKISNPTDEEHELIIDSKADGKTSEIAKSDDVEPGDNVEFTFKPEQAEELGYHCEYHPDMMNGTITVTESSS